MTNIVSSAPTLSPSPVKSAHVAPAAEEPTAAFARLRELHGNNPALLQKIAPYAQGTISVLERVNPAALNSIRQLLGL